MPGYNPLESLLDGYAYISNSGPDGIAISGTSQQLDTDDDRTTVRLSRVRDIVRTVHDWDVASEEELRSRAMRGEIK